MGIREGAGCGCEDQCTALSCLNAKESRFCTDWNCVFGGVCGNALRENTSLGIGRSSRTGMWGLTTTALIPAGEVIGEYLGHLQLFGPPYRNGPVNYRLTVHQAPRSSIRINFIFFGHGTLDLYV